MLHLVRKKVMVVKEQVSRTMVLIVLKDLRQLGNLI